jgi:magnesium chelatase subunit D
VLGSIDLEAAVQSGERAFEPGLLARANRGILYVDEVNLLADHLVDVLLDAVATGTNRVEREGVSVEHPADVLLVGTMNPEEGELRPQLLDRFGLSVATDDDLTREQRKTVVRRRTRFDTEPEAMLADRADEESALAERLVDARERLPAVTVGEDALDRIAACCLEHDVEGLRADVTIHRTARALAALDGASAVDPAHVDRAAELALGHRARTGEDRSGGGADPSGGDDGRPPDDGPEKPPPDERPDLSPRPRDGEDGTADGSAADETEPAGGGEASGTDGDGGAAPVADESSSDGESLSTAPTPEATGDDPSGDSVEGTEERVYPVGVGVDPPDLGSRRGSRSAAPAGQGGGARAATRDPLGAYSSARRPRGRPRDLALDATVRAAAPRQAARTDDERALALRAADLREKRREAPVRNLVVFVVDSSGSMGAYERMSAVTGAVLSLLAEAYRSRDYVALVGVRGRTAETVLAPTSAVDRAADELATMPTGGRTPLAAGLDRARRLVDRHGRTGATGGSLVVVLTDGRPNYAAGGDDPVAATLDAAGGLRAAGVDALCVDAETGPVRTGTVRRLAERMDAEYAAMADLEAAGLSARVEAALEGTFGRGS